jgi:thiol-disulfide isomerase/thioredoxin
LDGSVVEGRLAEVFGGLALIRNRNTSVFVGLEAMTDEELKRVNRFLAAQPSDVVRLQDSTSKVWQDIRGKLRSLQNGKVVTYEPGTRTEPEIYLVYFSAGWCPPCHHFTPELVEAYQRMQERWPGRVEVVLVSSDETSTHAEKYLRDARMPWPMLRFGSRAKTLTQWAANGIPCLVAVTRNGDVIFHSYQGEEYLGPRSVLEKCHQLLPYLDHNSPESKRSQHRLALQQHRDATGTSDSEVKPYLIQIDQSRANFIPEQGLTFLVEVDESGRVIDAALEAVSSSPFNDLMRPDLDRWLFLPAISQGKPVKAKVRVPLSRALAAKA